MLERDWSAFRQLLKELLQDAATKKLVEQRTDISPRTLVRWASGETEEPERKRLVSLLHALPQYHEALFAAITKAIPDFEGSLIDPAKSLVEELPLDFWIRLLETNAYTPANLHFMSVVQLIFLQLQSTIDPERLGIQLMLVQCSPPRSSDLPVRSLRKIFKMTTYQSLLANPGDTFFLGAESLSGYCVSWCQASIVQNVQEERHLPVRRYLNQDSAAAYPIQRGGSVAGCLLISCKESDFFSPQMQYLLQVYAYLLGLAFETVQFYPPERIHLRPMPAEQIQYNAIAGFQDRVMRLIQQDPSRTRVQAEREAWQQIEEDLLSFPLDMD
jgi:hypothetical protein